jgi:LAO/AO transport system kinase
VFIRSLASRGALGGLHPKIIEISDLMKGSGFDYVIIETVGVGQSEVDIAGLADITIVVLVPEAGDVIQTMKAGLMEVADIFVVNKYDRPGADIFYNHLRKMLSPAFNNKMGKTPVYKTIASQREGVSELYLEIKNWKYDLHKRNHIELITQRVWSVIHNKKMEQIDLEEMKKEIAKLLESGKFNLYRFVKNYV